MALDFPTGPLTEGQIHTDSTTGYRYEWDGIVWKNYFAPVVAGPAEIVGDASPQLGGDLDVNGNNITGTGGINLTGIVTATDFNSSSDITLKDNVHEIDNPIEKILQIRGVNFDWKENGASSAGVIAQDIENIMPELVKENNGTKTVNYNGLIGLLVEVAKKQQEEIKVLKEDAS